MVSRLRKSTLLLFAALSLFHVVITVTWWGLNRHPLPWDQANHTQLALGFHYCVRDARPLTECMRVSNYYPIASYLVASGAFFLFGAQAQVAQVVGLGFWLFALAGIFLFFTDALHDQRRALIVTFSVSLVPVLADVGRYFMTDLLLLGLTFFTMWGLLRSHGLRRRNWVIFVAVCTGFAMLTKWYAVLYLAVPYGLALWHFLKVFRFRTQRNALLFNMFLLACIASLIALPWYLTNVQDIVRQTLFYAGADDSQPHQLFSFVSLTWYARLAFQYQLFPLLFLFSCIGALCFASTRQKKGWKLYVLLYVFCGYLLFTFFGNKAIRYTFHLLVFYIYFVWVGIWWVRGKNRIMSYLLASIVLTYQLFFTINLPFRWPISHDVRWVEKIPGIGYVQLFNLSKDPVRPLSRYAWPTNEIAQDLFSIASNEKKALSVLILVDYPQLNSSNLRVKLLEKFKTLQIPVEMTVLESAILEDKKEYAGRFTHILMTDNQVGHDWHRGVFVRNKMQEFVFQSKNTFTQLKTYSFPLADLDLSILLGNNLGEERLPRKVLCQRQVCNTILLLEVK